MFYNNYKQHFLNYTLNQIKKYPKQKQFSFLTYNFYFQERYIQRLSIGIHRSIVLAHRIHEYIQENIHTNQINLLATIEKVNIRERHTLYINRKIFFQAEEKSRLNRVQTLEEIREEFTNYLTTVHKIILDSKVKFFSYFP